MFSKVIAVLAFAAVVAAKPQHQPAAQYPAGVDPSRCPSYPNCDNAALHNPNHQTYNNHAANHWNPNWNVQPSWNAAPAHAPAPAPYYNGAPHSYQALTGPSHNYLGAPAPTAGGDRYPAGVDPQACPNYPYCDNLAPAGVPQAAPLPGYTSRQYPAGVSAHTCPGYPYC
uniref:Cuticle protein CPCFC domain-containing protein n=1 Tax=Anopheles atroparvus TaxID=41427 RepID=A0A182IZN4_ANOAO